MLGATLLLSALSALVLQAFHTYRQEAAALRAEAYGAADVIIALADARAVADLAAVRLLSRSRSLAQRDYDAAARRAQEALDLVPGWQAVILSNRESGEILFEVAPSSVSFSGIVDFQLQPDVPPESFGGVVRDGRHCPCVYLHVVTPADENQVLTAIVNPMVFQLILRSELPEGTVAAIVDREGEFIARSLDYFDRVGTPATSYVRDAVARGGRAIYEGETYEGLKNYTAYTTSDLTGWSSHVAINSALVDASSGRANAVLLGGVLLAIVVSALLFLVAVRDTATRRREQQRLLELQRAEAVSHFTATVVHDFRNVIAALQSGLNMIKRQAGNDKITQHVEMIEKSIVKGTRLANQILSFSSSSDSEINDVSLAGLITEVRYLLEKAIDPGIALRIDPPPEGVVVRANQDQLELALLNLVVNARDAMTGKGKLRISFRVHGDRIEIAVSDTGPGVPPEARQTIFAPFHTNKAKGTGLGLAQVRGTARNAGGDVHVEEAPGGGACFVISLPRADRPA